MDQVNFVEDSLLAIYYFRKKNSIIDVWQGFEFASDF